MYTARLSLFCATALLVSGAYASEPADTSGATSLIGEANVQASLLDDAADAGTLRHFAELRRQAAREMRQHGSWQRIADEDTDTAERPSQPFSDTPRWVF